jgi:hypothetical protein
MSVIVGIACENALGGRKFFDPMHEVSDDKSKK